MYELHINALIINVLYDNLRPYCISSVIFNDIAASLICTLV
jgi:hypothetical protein